MDDPVLSLWLSIRKKLPKADSADIMEQKGQRKDYGWSKYED
jgi:hypothetical protein